MAARDDVSYDRLRPARLHVCAGKRHCPSYPFAQHSNIALQRRRVEWQQRTRHLCGISTAVWRSSWRRTPPTGLCLLELATKSASSRTINGCGCRFGTTDRRRIRNCRQPRPKELRRRQYKRQRPDAVIWCAHESASNSPRSPRRFCWFGLAALASIVTRKGSQSGRSRDCLLARRSGVSSRREFVRCPSRCIALYRRAVDA